VLDRRTQEQREPKSADFVEYVKLADGLKNIDYLSTAFIPKDIPQDIADAWRLYLVLAHSKRPIVSGAFTVVGRSADGRADGDVPRGQGRPREEADGDLHLLPEHAAALGRGPDREHHGLRGVGDPDRGGAGAAARHDLAHDDDRRARAAHAEVLSGLTIAQTVRPGTPVVFGGAPASFHMQLMTNPMTAVEALQVYCGYAEVAKHLKLPTQAYMALSDSKFNDPQAGMETGVGAFLAGERRDQLGLRPRHARLRQLLQLREAGVRRRGRRARASASCGPSR
jgi:trimethylamine--corrinoid protein Co-methyltransferase